MNELVVREHARQAFRRGRWREALLATAHSLPLVLAAAWFAASLGGVLPFGALLLLGSGVFAFWGREAGRVVVPALLLGALPLACSLAAPHIGHVCTGAGCVSLCPPLCGGGGLVAGVLLARLAASQRHPLQSWLCGALLVGSAGAMGCACVGLLGAAGMLLGLTLPQLVSMLRSRGTGAAA